MSRLNAHIVAALLAVSILSALSAAPARAASPETLVEEQAREAWGAELPEGASIRVSVQDPKPVDALIISAYWMDRDSGRFLANAVMENGQEKRIQGLALATMTLPVPNRRVMPGEILTEADLTELELPLRRVSAFAVLGRDDLLGKQVRRMLTRGRPVMSRSVTEPLVIDRGDRVSIVFDDGKLRVTAPGRALDDAQRGQELRIVNLVSSRTLRGIAREDGLVEVLR
ncbi:flagellar basal body P-ring formation chaperone FlgA [Brevirhabdus sp.]|uniref:flagellar basal body P-ring formation chaperone FlgA n=1 Tax=Brevirhabdus sp. TaxID=2004514 RepID=UPI004058A1BE